MRCLVLTAVILFSSLYQEGNALYSIYQVQKINRKIFKMCVDLIFDAISRIKHAQFLKKSYEDIPAYQFGAMVYEIRRKYARMLVIHKRMVKGFYKPDDRKEDLHEYQLLMIEAVHTGFEIDKLIGMIEEYQNKPYPFNRNIMELQIPTSKNPTLMKPSGRSDDKLREFFKHGRSQSKNFGISMAQYKNKLNSLRSRKFKNQLKLDGIGFDSDMN